MATYKIDAAHSEVTFKVKHLMIASVTGQFKEFDGSMTAEKADFTDASINFEALVNSITTGNDQRDGHLKSDDFFAAEKFPKLTFKSTAIQKLDEETYNLTGNLTIRDVTKPVTLKVTYGGQIIDPWGQTKLGFEIEGKINRKDFGLTWSATTETGGIVVSDDVKLHLNIELTKQA
ncbi:YceI family protein [Hydrotalea sandarakina]|jgi:polyisoprenoid-binding protein YceI|uniref:Polyisoprenoid-binding protein YceI n=1 Tax=Hydrotalea sandarakina TaxID=1004304 RepID=A0A2W7RP13_9BACT|nr:YceI family protein [Hydrotalea sandarakina]PZX60696.1 polyisoprenoid-binding protein YceI [Hydrotalea sandarakina]